MKDIRLITKLIEGYMVPCAKYVTWNGYMTDNAYDKMRSLYFTLCFSPCRQTYLIGCGSVGLSKLDWAQSVSSLGFHLTAIWLSQAIELPRAGRSQFVLVHAISFISLPPWSSIGPPSEPWVTSTSPQVQLSASFPSKTTGAQWGLFFLGKRHWLSNMI